MSANFNHIFDGKIEITTSVASFISYLHYHNQMKILDSVGIRTIDGNTHDNIRLEVRLYSGETSFADALTIGLGELGSATREETIDLKLNPVMFAAIRSNQTAEVSFEVFQLEQSLGEARVTVEMFPLNTWRCGFNRYRDILLLGSFSQPGDKAIPAIVAKSREIKSGMASPAGVSYGVDTVGYQSGPDSVRAETQALYEAIQSLRLEYSNPFPNANIPDGQPIRTVSEIVEDKSATCLDTAMMISSCLSYMGLRPLVVVVHGHAFAGVHLYEDFLDNPIQDLADISGLVVAGRIILFETTTLCVSEAPESFASAQAIVSRYLDPNFDPLKPGEPRDLDQRYVLDVTFAQSRYNVRPLPSVSIDASGEVTVVNTEIPKAEFSFTGTTSTPNITLRDDAAPDRVKIWKNSLLDMTFNNPLLNRERRVSAKVGIPKGKLGEIEDLLQQPNASLGIKPLEANDQPIQLSVFSELPESLNNRLNEVLVTQKAISVSGTERTLSALLKKLISSSKASVQETGVNNLYMTFGSLTWDKEPANERAGQVTSPLFLLPVTIKPAGRGGYSIQLDDTEDATPNETLALALSKHDIHVPVLSNPQMDDAGFDIQGLIAQVRHEINVVHKKTHWIVAEDATIGTFDFSSFHMWKDLNNNWSKLAEVPLVKHLIETDGTKPFIEPGASAALPDIVALDSEIEKLPIPSDEAQVKAILKSLSGESFIIQGPPGTGKSQTITNLLARNLQEGKRVLFMSEKAAALAVVKTRLDSIGLGPFVLDLHDKGTKPSSIRNQLLAALDAAVEGDPTGKSVATTTYETALKTLASYPDKLHLVNAKHQESIYSSRDRMLAVPGTQTLTLSADVLGKFEVEARRAFLEKLRDLPEVGRSAGTYITNAWSFSNIDLTELNLETKEALKLKVQKISEVFRDISSQTSTSVLLESISEFSELQELGIFEEGYLPSSGDLSLARTPEASINRQQLKTSLSKLISATSQMKNYQEKLAQLNIDEIEVALNEALAKRFLQGRKLERVAQQVNPFLLIPVTRDQVGHAFKELKIVVPLAHKVSELVEKTVGLGDIAGVEVFTITGLQEIDKRLRKLENLISATDASSRPNATLLQSALSDGNTAALKALGFISRLLADLFESLKMDDASIANWMHESKFGKTLTQAIPKWSEDCLNGDLRQLTRWSLVIDLLSPLTKAGQNTAFVEVLSGKVSYDEAAFAFERSFLNLLFWKLLDDQNLHNFDGVEHDSKIEQFDSALVALRKHNQETIASQVLEGRKFDARSSVGVSGALRAELGKARAQMPVRKLLQTYWETITQIAPIVAASPDSVARFLDINTAKFDLVVFDEASQIRVATSIGALGRASQAIVVGDSKQMPPTSIFRKADGSGEEEYDEEDAYSLNDQESILTMAVVSQIPSVMLTWHYRSQDEILIAFSNKEIYEGKLSSFPSPRFGEQALSDRKLRFEYEEDNFYVSSGRRAAKAGDGNSRANTNLSEAKRVVKAIQKYVKDTPANEASLGVITMNEQQRQLIEDLLDEIPDEKLTLLRSSEKYPEDYIFVRALERVQGDERDVILFSLGFGPESQGARVNLNFGPLIRSGSERRLNVAITRARKEMVVFASFRAKDMTIAETASKGMHLLKKFLEFIAGGEVDLRISPRAVAEDRHRADVANALRAAGLKVSERHGMSNFRVDIAVADPNDETKCILAIMLDGKGWLDRKTSADREILPRTVLKKNMNWPAVERIWLPMWLRDPQNEVKRILSAVDKAVKAKSIAKEEPSIATMVSIQSVQGENQELHHSPEIEIKNPPQSVIGRGTILGVNIDEIPEFQELPDEMVVEDKAYIQYLHDPAIIKVVEELVTLLTEAEGAVSPKRVTSFIAKCFGLRSVQSARQQEILGAISKSKFKRDDEGFIYPAGRGPEKYFTWSKQSDAGERPLADISLVEIANAMATLCSKTNGMESTELAKQSALAFGNSRLSGSGEMRMYEAEELGLKTGRLRQENGITFKG